MAPFFSILMPVYNAEPYIGEAIESLRLQTFTDWELLVVDDGSTDNSLRIAESYSRKDSRIRIDKLPAHIGSPVLVRLQGLKKAQGKYIVEIDSDDFISAEYLKKIYDKIISTGAQTVLAEICRVDRYGNVINKQITNSTTRMENCFSGKELMVDMGNLSGLGAFEKATMDFVTESYDIPWECYNSDELLTKIIIFHSSKVAFTDAVYYYRKIDNSITHTSSHRRHEYIKSHEFFDRFILNHFSADSKEYEVIQTKKIDIVYDFIAEANKVGKNKLEKDNLLRLAKNLRQRINRKSLRNWKHKIFVSLNFTLLRGLIGINEKRRRNKRI